MWSARIQLVVATAPVVQVDEVATVPVLAGSQ